MYQCNKLRRIRRSLLFYTTGLDIFIIIKKRNTSWYSALCAVSLFSLTCFALYDTLPFGPLVFKHIRRIRTYVHITVFVGVLLGNTDNVV